MLLDLYQFAMRNHNVSNVGWNYTSKFICGKHGWHLVDIHSQTEQDFIGYYLQHKAQTSRRHLLNSTGYYGYAYLGKYHYDIVFKIKLRHADI